MKSNEAERLIDSISTFRSIVSDLKGFKSAKLLSAAKTLELAALPLIEEVVRNMDGIVQNVFVRIKENHPGLIYSMNNIVLSSDWEDRLDNYLRTVIVAVVNEHRNQDAYLDIDLWFDFIEYRVTESLRSHNINNQLN